jgi:hypothetical protein
VQRETTPDPSQVAEQVGQLVDARLRVPVGADDHQAFVGRRLGEEPEQEQGRRVRRVQVVEDHQHRTGVGGLAQELTHRIERRTPAGPDPCG